MNPGVFYHTCPQLCPPSVEGPGLTFQNHHLYCPHHHCTTPGEPLFPLHRGLLHLSPHSRGSHINQWDQQGRCCTRFTDKDTDTREGRWACLQAEGGQLHRWALRMDGQIREGCLEQAC